MFFVRALIPSGRLIAFRTFPSDKTQKSPHAGAGHCIPAEVCLSIAQRKGVGFDVKVLNAMNCELSGLRRDTLGAEKTSREWSG
jgi:hypothetical protein